MLEGFEDRAEVFENVFALTFEELFFGLDSLLRIFNALECFEFLNALLTFRMVVFVVVVLVSAHGRPIS